MGIEKRASKPRHKIDPGEEMCDLMGLPREAKYDIFEAGLNALPLEDLEELMQIRDPYLNRSTRRPVVFWQTVEDVIRIQFRTAENSKRTILDSQRFLDYDEVGNLAGVVLRDVSSGVEMQGLPEAQRINRMLRRRDIAVLKPGIIPQK